MKLAIEPGQRAAAGRALELAYQGDLAGARLQCRTVAARQAVFAANPMRGAELWPDMLADGTA